ncbi:MAG: cob(I)yrinic acid a,c-diamide adenosyltransferase [Sedimentisphaeraceae bacterium JB056]
MIKNGLVQIYTGEGKGKTTAAFGLAFRAAGDDNKVLIYQFLKPESLELSERRAVEKCGLDIEIRALGIEWNMRKSHSDACIKKETKELVKKTLAEIAQMAEKKEYNVIILDELVYCHSQSLASTKDIKRIIDCRDKAVEIVMTGREAKSSLIDMADLVSEIKAVKHPFEKGIHARKGIEY